MFAIDTNLLVYAHNEDSRFNEKSSAFLEKVLNERDEEKRCSMFRKLDSEKLEDWLESCGLSELWEKNVLGGQP